MDLNGRTTYVSDKTCVVSAGQAPDAATLIVRGVACRHSTLVILNFPALSSTGGVTTQYLLPLAPGARRGDALERAHSDASPDFILPSQSLTSTRHAVVRST